MYKVLNKMSETSIRLIVMFFVNTKTDFANWQNVSVLAEEAIKEMAYSVLLTVVSSVLKNVFFVDVKGTLVTALMDFINIV